MFALRFDVRYRHIAKTRGGGRWINDIIDINGPRQVRTLRALRTLILTNLSQGQHSRAFAVDHDYYGEVP